MSGWDTLEGNNKRISARVIEIAKLRGPGHLGLDHVTSRARACAQGSRSTYKSLEDPTIARPRQRAHDHRSSPRFPRRKLQEWKQGRVLAHAPPTRQSPRSPSPCLALYSIFKGDVHGHFTHVNQQVGRIPAFATAGSSVVMERQKQVTTRPPSAMYDVSVLGT
eukprot:1115573-Prymnesium_polylepis.1